MAGIPSEHAHDVREALRIIVSDPGHGAATLSSPQAMSNLLKDLLPDAPKEKNLLVAAAEADLAGMMRDHVAQGIDTGSAIRLAAASLAANTHFTGGVCTWVATELAAALGLGPATADARSGLPAEDIATAEPAAPEPAAAEPATARPASQSQDAEPPSAETVHAQTRHATQLLGTDGQDADSSPAVAAASPARRRASPGAVLVLVGLLGALAAYLIPSYYDSYYGGVSIWGSGFPAYVTDVGTIVLVLAALCEAQIVLGREGRIKIATGAALVACGIAMLLIFGGIYWRSVKTNGDQMGAGLVAGVISAVLLIAGGLAVLIRQRAEGRAAVGQAGSAAS